MSKKKTTEEWVKEAKEVHGDKYDYSESVYVNAKTKLIIICSTHGRFEQEASSHLSGCGCPDCVSEKTGDRSRLNPDIYTQKIMEKCKERGYEFRGFVGGIYKNNQTKLILFCYKDNYEWETTSYNNFVGNNRGCPKCGGTEKKLVQQYIELGFLPDQSFDGGVLKTYKYPCSDCGKIEKKLFNHVKNGHTRCKSCGNAIIAQKLVKIQPEDYIKIGFLPNQKFGNVLEGYYHKCVRCGEKSKRTYMSVINGKDCCNSCKGEVIGEKQRLCEEEVIEKIQKKCVEREYEFRGFVDGKYNGNNTKLILYCIKDDFVWKSTTYSHFIYGNISCPKCQISKLEKSVITFLENNKINYIYRYKGFNWLRRKTCPMELDFYLPAYSIAIECQGIQHSESRVFFGGEKEFEEIQKRDTLKRLHCEQNGIKLYYIYFYDSENDIEMKLKKWLGNYIT